VSRVAGHPSKRIHPPAQSFQPEFDSGMPVGAPQRSSDPVLWLANG